MMSHGEGVELDFDPYETVYADGPHTFENWGTGRCEVKHRDGSKCGKFSWEHVFETSLCDR